MGQFEKLCAIAADTARAAQDATPKIGSTKFLIGAVWTRNFVKGQNVETKTKNLRVAVSYGPVEIRQDCSQGCKTSNRTRHRGAAVALLHGHPCRSLDGGARFAPFPLRHGSGGFQIQL